MLQPPASGRHPFLRAALALAAVALTACASISGRSTVAPMRVYVANSADETITILDAESGLPLVQSLPGGPAPEQIVAGPNGNLLAVSALAGVGGVRHISPSGDSWLSSSVPVEARIADAIAATDGVRRVAVAYRVVAGAPDSSAARLPFGARQSARCRIALIDGWYGTVQNTLTACAAGERVSGLALNTDSGEPRIYLSIRQDTGVPLPGTGGASSARPGPLSAPPGPLTSGFVAGRNRLAVIDASTGKVITARQLESAPTHLVASPNIHGKPQWLYAIQEPEPRRGVTPGIARQLLRVRAESLEVDRQITVGAVVDAMATLDGSSVYLLQGDTISRVTISTSKVHTVARLPSPGHDLAVTPRWLFVTNPDGGEVWVLDRNSGELVRRVATGSQPLGISAALA